MSSEFGDELQDMELDLREMKENIRNLTDAVLELNSHNIISPELKSMLKAITRKELPKK